MSDEKKFLTEDELAQVKAFGAQKSNITFALGDNRLRKEALLNSYRALVVQEQEFHNKLAIKYGDISLDLNTGEITPSQQPSEQN